MGPWEGRTDPGGTCPSDRHFRPLGDVPGAERDVSRGHPGLELLLRLARVPVRRLNHVLIMRNKLGSNLVTGTARWRLAEARPFKAGKRPCFRVLLGAPGRGRGGQDTAPFVTCFRAAVSVASGTHAAFRCALVGTGLAEAAAGFSPLCWRAGPRPRGWPPPQVWVVSGLCVCWSGDVLSHRLAGPASCCLSSWGGGESLGSVFQ